MTYILDSHPPENLSYYLGFPHWYKNPSCKDNYTTIIGERDEDKLTAIGISIAHELAEISAYPVIYINVRQTARSLRILMKRKVDLDVSGYKYYQKKEFKEVSIQVIEPKNGIIVIDVKSGDLDTIIELVRRYSRSNEGLIAVIIDADLIDIEKTVKKIDELGEEWSEKDTQDWIINTQRIFSRLQALAEEVNTQIVMLMQINNWDWKSKKEPDLSSISFLPDVKDIVDSIILLNPDMTMKKRGVSETTFRTIKNGHNRHLPKEGKLLYDRGEKVFYSKQKINLTMQDWEERQLPHPKP